MKVRGISPEDYSKIADFWKENCRFTKRDAKEKVEILLEKNPGLSVLADEGGEVLGTSLASFDDREGYIQKVVAREDYRGKGLGSRLVQEAGERLKKAGALDIRVNCSQKLVHFYRKFGFQVKKGLVPLQIKDY